MLINRQCISDPKVSKIMIKLRDHIRIISCIGKRTKNMMINDINKIIIIKIRIDVPMLFGSKLHKLVMNGSNDRIDANFRRIELQP